MSPNTALTTAFRSSAEKDKKRFAGFELRHRTLGVVGLGNIGRWVAIRAHAGLRMNVLGYDPGISADAREFLEYVGVELVDSLERVASPQRRGVAARTWRTADRRHDWPARVRAHEDGRDAREHGSGTVGSDGTTDRRAQCWQGGEVSHRPTGCRH